MGYLSLAYQAGVGGFMFVVKQFNKVSISRWWEVGRFDNAQEAKALAHHQAKREREWIYVVNITTDVVIAVYQPGGDIWSIEG